MDIRIIRLESELGRIESELRGARNSELRYASLESRLDKLREEMRATSIRSPELSGVEKILCLMTSVSLGLAMLALIVAVPARREESPPSETATPPAISARPAS